MEVDGARGRGRSRVWNAEEWGGDTESGTDQHGELEMQVKVIGGPGGAAGGAVGEGSCSSTAGGLGVGGIQYGTHRWVHVRLASPAMAPIIKDLEEGLLR